MVIVITTAYYCHSGKEEKKSWSHLFRQKCLLNKAQNSKETVFIQENFKGPVSFWLSNNSVLVHLTTNFNLHSTNYYFNSFRIWFSTVLDAMMMKAVMLEPSSSSTSCSPNVNCRTTDKDFLIWKSVKMFLNKFRLKVQKQSSENEHMNRLPAD